MKECRFDNRIRNSSLIIPEKFFVDQKSITEEFIANGKKRRHKIIKKTVTNIPSLGWKIETVNHMDNDVTYKWLTWAETKIGNPVEVKVPLPTISITQRIWRFYGFRISLSDILQNKILSILGGKDIFQISSLKLQISRDTCTVGTYKLEIESYNRIIWISIFLICKPEEKGFKLKELDRQLLDKATEIKSYIENL